MNRDGFPDWPVSIGFWWGIHVRFSMLLPILAAVLCLQMESIFWPLIFSGIFLVSLILHEVGHLLGAWLSGGHGDELTLSPIGGLSHAQPATNSWSYCLTAMGGTLVNGVCCIAFLPSVLHDSSLHALNPFHFPISSEATFSFSAVCLLAFYANWLILLMNLLPLTPLDAGRLIHLHLQWRYGATPAFVFVTKLGVLLSLPLFVLGLVALLPWCMGFAAYVMFWNYREAMLGIDQDRFDDSFLGYDFSEGYTSLERSEEQTAAEEPGLIEGWLARRREEKARKKLEQEQQAEADLDRLLEKVHTHGIDSLTDDEQKLLKRVSARYRQNNDS
ncbi:DUF6576 domain-containing protein [Calycomorphotria hydatis]|uniref:Peptidase family M50 n=1 Tax=Calycomorphotria hydatis TaxID=2528027 RepID=A0A517T764_9PLAN|nr:DUF6576 domain-containing protein [Calycomorphotria hydatis]QDT64215.1 Peptidase family M50 [Calycomorphotria hydatis]